MSGCCAFRRRYCCIMGVWSARGGPDIANKLSPITETSGFRDRQSGSIDLQPRKKHVRRRVAVTRFERPRERISADQPADADLEMACDREVVDVPHGQFAHSKRLARQRVSRREQFVLVTELDSPEKRVNSRQ